MKDKYVFLKLLCVLLFLSSQIMAQTPVSPISGATGVVLSLEKLAWSAFGANGLDGNKRYYVALFEGAKQPGKLPITEMGNTTQTQFILPPEVLPFKNNQTYYWYVNNVLEPNTVYEYYFTTYPKVPISLLWPKTTSAISSENITFSWSTTGSTNGMIFTLQIVAKDDTPQKADWESGFRFFTNEFTKTINLPGGKKYYWRVIVNNEAMEALTYSEPASFRTSGGATIKSFVSWPKNNLEYTLTPALYWYADQYVTDMKFQIRIVEGGAGACDVDGKLTNGSSIPANDDDVVTNGFEGYSTLIPFALHAGSLYWWQVRAYDPISDEFGAWTVPVKFNTFGAATDIQKAVLTYPNNQPVYTTLPSFYWYYPASAEGLSFILKIYSSDDINNPVQRIANLDVTNVELSEPLLPGKSYFWEVGVTDGAATVWSGIKPFSVVGGATSRAVVAWPKNNPTVYTNRPVLSWFLDGFNLGVTGYKIKYSKQDQGDNWGNFNNVDGSINADGGVFRIMDPDVTSWEVTADLLYGQKYFWAVSVKNDPARYSTGSFTVIGGGTNVIPTIVHPKNAAVVYSTDVTLSWFVNSSTEAITGYSVQYAASSDNAVLAAAQVHSTPETSYLLEGLTAGVTYYWRIKSNVSDWSPVYHFTVAPGSGSLVAPIIGGPDNIELATGTVTLAWRVPVPKEDQKYDVIIADNPEFVDAKTYSNIDKQVLEVNSLNAASYYWKVRAADGNGNITPYSDAGQFVISSTTGVEGTEIPVEFRLEQNYPNPFNPSTTIKYAIPVASHVKVSIYNTLGQEIKTLVNTDKSAGVYTVEWKGDDNAGNKVTSGIYIYKVTAGENISSRKMVLMK